MIGTGGRLALLAVAGVGAFLAGRAWPGPSAAVAPTAAVAPAPPPPAPADRARPAPTRPPTPSARARSSPWPIAGAEVLDDFARAARVDPDAASRLRSSVVVALEARRRLHNAALRLCLDRGEMVEETQLRFAVEVRTVDRCIDVGPAVMADVTEGPGLTDATLACLLAALDDQLSVELAPGLPVIAFDGTVDVPLRFAPARHP